jgi:hypothetical protein
MKYFHELMEAASDGLSKIFDVTHWNDGIAKKFIEQAGSVAMQGSDGEFYLGYAKGATQPQKLYVTKAGLGNAKLMALVKSYKVQPLSEDVSPELLAEARHGRRLVAQRDAIITQVMKEILHFGNVDETGSDHMDFKEVSVWNVRRALSVGFDKGYKYAQNETRTKDSGGGAPDPNGDSGSPGSFKSVNSGAK